MDEYSRWCYWEIHAELSDYASAGFIRRAVEVSPFKIRAAQTDNGHEFIIALFGQNREELTRFELALAELEINYRRIRAGTPKHNGRVERQHSLDMKRFYKRQKFTFLEE